MKIKMFCLINFSSFLVRELLIKIIPNYYHKEYYLFLIPLLILLVSYILLEDSQ